MTDKEWKELCEWAKNLHRDFIVVDSNNQYIAIGEIYGIEFYITDDGNIRGSWGEIMSCYRSSKQIKAIIENLL